MTITVAVVYIIGVVFICTTIILWRLISIEMGLRNIFQYITNNLPTLLEAIEGDHPY